MIDQPYILAVASATVAVQIAELCPYLTLGV
jgi:hypothetical protein